MERPLDRQEGLVRRGPGLDRHPARRPDHERHRADRVLSCLNSGLYTASRMAFSLGQRGDAPKAFARTNTRGVPQAAILASVVFGFLAVGFNYLWPDTVFQFLLNSSARSRSSSGWSSGSRSCGCGASSSAPEKVCVDVAVPVSDVGTIAAIIALCVGMLVLPETRSQMYVSMGDSPWSWSESGSTASARAGPPTRRRIPRPPAKRSTHSAHELGSARQFAYRTVVRSRNSAYSPAEERPDPPARGRTEAHEVGDSGCEQRRRHTRTPRVAGVRADRGSRAQRRRGARRGLPEDPRHRVRHR